MHVMVRNFHVASAFLHFSRIDLYLRWANSLSRRCISNSSLDPTRIRNIGIIAHIDAGKTTTTERMLYYAGHSKRLGNVDEGTTVMDFLPQERERGITIQSSTITFGWKLEEEIHQLNLVDTPGHVDFTFEVERSLRVLDGAVTILDAVAGVEAQTATVWSQANLNRIPRIVFVNKIDRMGASLEKSVQGLKNQLNCNPILLQIPFKDEGLNQFHAIGDVITMKVMHWAPSADGKIYGNKEPSETELKLLTQARTELVEKVADLDEAILNTYLELDDSLLVPNDILYQAIRTGTLNGDLVPVLIGASFRNMGVQPLLDAIVRYLPSPVDRNGILARDLKTSKELTVRLQDQHLCAYAFKVVFDHQRGYLTYVRVYSGRLAQREKIYNSSRSVKEHVNKVFLMYANECEQVSDLVGGQIGVLVGLKNTFTGDTLVGIHSPEMVLSSSKIPSPVYTASIEPKTAVEAKDLENALEHLVREDPSVRLLEDQDSNQILIAGMGELHMEIVRDRLVRQYKVDAIMGPVQIAFRESLAHDSPCILEDVYSATDLSGNTLSQVIINASLEPINSFRSDGMLELFENEVDLSQLQISPEIKKVVSTAILGALSRGPIEGNPLTNVKAVLSKLQILGSPALKNSESNLFASAAYWGVKKILSASPVNKIEPVMKVTIHCPINKIGIVLNDLAKRNGRILGVVSDSSTTMVTQTIVAQVALAEMQGYATDFRNITAGSGSFEMVLDAYDICSRK